MAHDIFISHAQADKAVADLVCATLEQRGVRCWIAPRDIRPGADWGGAIVGAIRECRAMVVIFSDAANASRHIPRELERAIDLEIPIVPFRIENVAPRGSLEYNLALVHWLDASSPPLDAHAERLADVVTAMLGRSAAPVVHTPAAAAPVAEAPPVIAPPAVERPVDTPPVETRRDPPLDFADRVPRSPRSHARAIWLTVAVVATAGIFFALNSVRRNPASTSESAPTELSQVVSGESAPPTPGAPAPGAAANDTSQGPVMGDDAWKDCSGSDQASVIVGCTAIIQVNGDDRARTGRAYFNRGMAYYAQARYDVAIDDYTQALALDFSPTYTYNNRGLAYAATKDFTRAAADYDRAIQLDPSLPDPFSNRADLTLQVDQNNLDAAIADYTRALAIDPKLARALRSRGGAYYRKQNFDSALSDFSNYLALKPDDVEVLTFRGIALALKKDFAGAIQDFTRVIELGPDNPDPLFSRGVVYLMQRDSERALADLSAYVTRKPDEAAGYRARGIAYFQRSLFVLAKNDLTRCLSLNANDAQALYALGAAKELTGDGAGGKSDIAAALKIDPSITDLMTLLGVVRK